MGDGLCDMGNVVLRLAVRSHSVQYGGWMDV